MKYSNGQLTALVLLRVLIGWHFLYEGLAKLINPYWTSAGYLLESEWIFAGLFKALAEQPILLPIVDFINVWGLILIGTCLIAGLFVRYVALAGVVLLLLYYLAHPPLIGLESPLPKEGSYLLIDKNLIEAVALLVLALFPTGHILGLDRILLKSKRFDSNE
jgi:thiosulfate dehydrogenase [quinone] large subunit